MQEDTSPAQPETTPKLSPAVHWRARALAAEKIAATFLESFGRKSVCRTCREPVWWIVNFNGRSVAVSSTLERHSCNEDQLPTNKQLISRQATKRPRRKELLRMLRSLPAPARHACYIAWADEIMRHFFHPPHQDR